MGMVLYILFAIISNNSFMKVKIRRGNAKAFFSINAVEMAEIMEYFTHPGCEAHTINTHSLSKKVQDQMLQTHRCRPNGLSDSEHEQHL